MLFLTDDNDFRGDSQDITIDVSLAVWTMHAGCSLSMFHQSGQWAGCLFLQEIKEATQQG